MKLGLVHNSLKRSEYLVYFDPNQSTSGFRSYLRIGSEALGHIQETAFRKITKEYKHTLPIFRLLYK